MAIPEAQLETWSHQGAIRGSSETYATVRAVLDQAEASYASRPYEIHLQGSYCNDTNIFAESDVDVVMRLNDVFYHDLEALTPAEKVAFDGAFPNGIYTLAAFKAEVLGQLKAVFGSDVSVGGKAIAIAERNNRRAADVLVSAEFRRYHKFRNYGDQVYVEGLCFFDEFGNRIENFPKQHSANCTAKHQRTGQRFKPTVRIFKNIRSTLVGAGLLANGMAPSYFIEGLLYNVPDSQFIGNYGSTVVNVLNWLQGADKSEFVCANEQFYLLRDSNKVTWPPAHCESFLASAVTLWNEW